MAASRKLQGEIDRCLKKVSEGVETFEDIWQKVHNATNTNQKEKYETDLKKEIKKLQRLRDQIKTWIACGEIKDKSMLVDTRKLIETQMERFKVVERETKTKAFSKEGLGAAQKLDPLTRERDDLNNWLASSIDSLQIQMDQFESEIEVIMAGKKKKLDKDKQDRLDELKVFVEKHKFHMGKLETLLRMLDNLVGEDQTELSHFLDQVKKIKDDIEYYLESSQEPEFEDNEFLYDDIDGLEEQQALGNTIAAGGGLDSDILGTTPTSVISGGKSPSPTTVSPTYSNNNSDNSSSCDPLTDKQRRKSSEDSSILGSGQSANKVVVMRPVPVKPNVNNTHNTSNCSSPTMNLNQNHKSSSSPPSSVQPEHETPNNSSPSSGLQSNHLSSFSSLSSSPTQTATTPATNNVNNAKSQLQTNLESGILESSSSLNPGIPDESHISSDNIAANLNTANNSSNGLNNLNQSSHGVVGESESSSIINNYHHFSNNIDEQQSQSISGNSDICPQMSQSQQYISQTDEEHMNIEFVTCEDLGEHLPSNEPSTNPTSNPNIMSSLAAMSMSALMNNTNHLIGHGQSHSIPPGILGITTSETGVTTNGPQSITSSSNAELLLQHLTQQQQELLQQQKQNGGINTQEAPTSTPPPSGATLLNHAHLLDQFLNNPDTSSSGGSMDVHSLKSMAQEVMERTVGGYSHHHNSTNHNSMDQHGLNSSVPSTTSAHIPPLLGVAPLGPVQLTSEHHTQLQMLETAHYHLPLPSDSERMRQFLPRNTVITPNYYPQVPLSNSDSIDFFNRLSIETLFFIFYYLEGTKAQYLAAKVLKKQSWRFHTKYMMWFQRHEEPKVINEEYEQGTYIYFDIEKWGQRKKDGFVFEYRYLEDRDLS